MHLMVATPIYESSLPINTVMCLLNETLMAYELGDHMQFKFLPACSHPAMGRNQLAQEFMDSGCDRLVFLDSDVSFEPGYLLKIAKYPVDFCGGAYRYKTDLEQYPVGWLGTDLWSNDQGLLEVSALPGGFLSLSRKVFETLKEKHPDRTYEHFGKVNHAYFQMPFVNGRLCGEDAYFCKEWREAGGKVWLDPEITLTHWKNHQPFVGCIGSWLKARSLDRQ